MVMLPLNALKNAEQNLRRQLKRLGFDEDSKNLSLPELIREQGEDRRHYRWPIVPADNDAIQYRYNFEAIGDYLHLSSIELSKVVTRDELGRAEKVVSQIYPNDRMLDGKASLDDDFRFVLRHAALKDELALNTDLRSQLDAMGFDYKQLVDSSIDLFRGSGSRLGLAMMHEHVPMAIPGRIHQVDLWIVINLFKNLYNRHQIANIEATSNRGVLNSGDRSLAQTYQDQGTGYPSRTDIINEMNAKERIAFASSRRAYQLIQELNNRPENGIHRIIKQCKI